jgi:hypothetical protein
VTAAEIEAVIAAYQITYATPVITGGRLVHPAGDGDTVRWTDIQDLR